VTGIGPDANKPPRKKAKLIRLERKYQKLLNRGLTQEAADAMLKQRKPQQQEGKSLEDLLNEPLPPNPAHRLEVIDHKSGSQPEGGI
jgi:arginine-tRNA-protein transferase